MSSLSDGPCSYVKISERLRNLGRLPAPIEVRRRVLVALDAEHSAGTRSDSSVRSRLLLSVRPMRWLLPVAGVAAMLIVVLQPITLPRPTLPASDTLLATALAGLPTTASLSSSNGDEVREWLQLRVGYAVEVPDIAGASIVGGRIAVIEGATAAAVAYTMHGKPLTYVAVPSESVLSARIAQDDVRTESANGYNVVVWRELGLVRAVVSPMSSDEVSSVANQCRRKAPI